MPFPSRNHFLSALRLSLRPYGGGAGWLGGQHGYCAASPQNTRIEKLLIANRGEIACRVMRTAKKLGIRTVAVYSDADKESMHVAMADEAYHIGAAPSVDSYLDQNKIMTVARKSQAQAIHPGYGFLSENPEFAEMCQREGVVFVGPPSSAIRDMGIKSTSKSIMSAAGVPIIKGYHGDDQSDAKLRAEADLIGYPVMIKAIRGGGGKGMKIASTPSDFEDALKAARSEAESSFGDSGMLLEKFVESPRHVEVQVFGDHHGNYVYLFERDCSVQRRHQKIIEEAPAPGISEEVRRRLGEAAVKAAQAVSYVGAGTVEFIMDSNQDFYFMEMNTRLQVEHPVTEMVTDTDLVEWQIRVASGEKMPMSQEEIKLRGHAFEARIYAEDPSTDFLPGSGSLIHLETPPPSETVRIETGVRQGDEVSIYYDPMIAKLVVWSDERQTALKKLHDCLNSYHVAGLRTNIGFLTDLSEHAQFRAGKVHTGFIGEHQEELFGERELSREVVCQAALGLVLYQRHANQTSYSSNSADAFSPFGGDSPIRLNHTLTHTVRLQEGENTTEVTVRHNREAGTYAMTVGGKEFEVEGRIRSTSNGLQLSYCVNGQTGLGKVVVSDDSLHYFTVDGSHEFKIPEPDFLSKIDESSKRSGTVAPMTGKVDEVLVKDGDAVKKDQLILILEAMKLKYEVRAPEDGVVESVLCEPNSQVQRGMKLVKFKENKDGN